MSYSYCRPVPSRLYLAAPGSVSLPAAPTPRLRLPDHKLNQATVRGNLARKYDYPGYYFYYFYYSYYFYYFYYFY